MQRALKRFVEVGGKDAVRSLNLAGRLWTSFALKQTRQADPNEIRRYLTTRIRTVKSARHEYAGTIAEAIVLKQLGRGGQRLSARTFAARVRQFVNTSVRSAGFHKSGWIPSAKEFKVRGRNSRGRGRFRRPPQGRGQTATRNQPNPSGFLENYARGILQVQGDVLSRTELQVARQLEKFLVSDLVREGRKAGFQTRAR